MFLHVEEANHVKDYIIWVRFNDGSEGEVDLSDELNGPVFSPLKDIDYFKRFEVHLHTVAWENGADFAPEFLKEKLT